MARLTLKNGQWFEVKDKLKVIDKKNVHSYSVDGVSSDGQTYRFNVVKHQIATAAVRITGWSLLDDHGKGIVWPFGKKSFKERIDIVEELDEDAFDEITDLLSKHFKDVEEAETDEKKETPDGETASGQSLPSAS